MKRKIANYEVSAIGLGCMNLSHAYGVPPGFEDAKAVLLAALDSGVTHFDTAALYGFGANEELLGKVLAPHRDKIFLASKCGMTGVDGKRVIDARPETIKQTCNEALKRLQTDVIDLYYLHRWDKNVPIEDSIGALAELVEAGKIKSIGLSEVSAETLRKAHATHPVAAVQTEYSLWTRNAEIAVLNACRELDIAFVAFSPLGRGFLADAMPSVESIESFEAKDLRRNMPRFQTEHWSKNVALLEKYREIASDAECSPTQLALSWLLAQGEHVLPIPGTTNIDHLEENLCAMNINLSAEIMSRVEELINQDTVSGTRYNTATQAEIDTEEF